MGLPLFMDLATLSLSDSALHTFTSSLQGVVADGVSTLLPSPSPSAPTGKVEMFFLLHLRFGCGLEMYGELPPIWEAVA